MINHRDWKQDKINGQSCPEKVKINDGFIKKDPKGKSDIIDRLNYRKKQIGVQMMIIELEIK